MANVQKRWELWFYINRSIRYHLRREGFFLAWHRFTLAISILFATAAFGAIANRMPWWIGAGAAMLVSIFSVFDLAVGTGEQARRHESLRRRFVALDRDLPEELTDDQARQFEGAIRIIEMDEPPNFPLLDSLCHNELIYVSGCEDEPVPIPFYKRWTIHLWRWDAPRVEPPAPDNHLDS